jgi:hypothetical protein
VEPINAKLRSRSALASFRSFCGDSFNSTVPIILQQSMLCDQEMSDAPAPEEEGFSCEMNDDHTKYWK